MKSSQVRWALAILVITGLLYGCASHYNKKFDGGIQKNQQALFKIQRGMSREEVMKIFGQGEIVRYKRIFLVNPWKSEDFQRKDGVHLDVLYYVTQRPHSWSSIQDTDLTPLVLEDGRLTGWGWTHLHSRMDQVSNPTTPTK